MPRQPPQFEAHSESNNVIMCTGLSCFIICTSIPSIIMSSIDFGSCDHISPMMMNVSEFLKWSGIITFPVAFTSTLFMTLKHANAFIFAFSKLWLVYDVIWLIIGAVILFRSNIDCIYESSPQVVFALVLWCVNLLAFSIAIFLTLYSALKKCIPGCRD